MAKQHFSRLSRAIRAVVVAATLGNATPAAAEWLIIPLAGTLPLGASNQRAYGVAANCSARTELAWKLMSHAGRDSGTSRMCTEVISRPRS